ncbi:DUF3492 domain-containing protein [Streptomyces genisteinicus]|uniref:D-inositol 3-phosphate glycosyltransferase n=1 Tax=Streptomyces genisteinicus TaxID=2768068 RepID=A0A7H0HXB8_9ACTN|nr:DUF3492 domain-containing protein [Streptomyces genisteinicus]QNP65184.1 DUF3492 domain-containing protein [Streptomyces genisteinicus]
MRIGMLTEGGFPSASGEAGLWCDRLVRGLPQHEFDVYTLSRGAREETAAPELPAHVRLARSAALWAPADDGVSLGRRARRSFAEHFATLVRAVSCDGDGFADGLHGLAGLARDHGGLPAALRSEVALRALESACRAPGAHRALQAVTVPDLLETADRVERALRPLSLDWYEDDGLASADLCHAASGGPAALAGLLAKRFCGVPLLVTEYGVHLRGRYLEGREDGLSAPVRALLGGFHRLLAREIYAMADMITPGNTHARRWQEQCGADRSRLRTVYPGMAADGFAAVGESGDSQDPDAHGDGRTLVWVGRVEPAKDLVGLLHAFAAVREEEPGARLRLFTAPARDEESAGHLAHCRALAAQLFPDEAADAHAVGDSPVSFEEIGGPDAPEPADAYAAGSVVVLSSVVEGFPLSLVEAMFCGRATVSTDVGAVVEVIGGTGLVVPPRNPRALADACLALLRDPERRARLGAAARARALELFTVEQNLAAFRGIYLELISRSPVRRPAEAVDADGGPVPFAHPAEAQVAGRLSGAAHIPSWAAEAAFVPLAGADGPETATEVPR